MIYFQIFRTMFRYHINFGRKEMYIFSEKPDSLGTL